MRPQLGMSVDFPELCLNSVCCLHPPTIAYDIWSCWYFHYSVELNTTQSIQLMENISERGDIHPFGSHTMPIWYLYNNLGIITVISSQSNHTPYIRLIVLIENIREVVRRTLHQQPNHVHGTS